jgi:hypothetical protein
MDRNLMFQQNVGAAGVAIVVVHARTNRITAAPGQVARVGA